ncbi:MAG: hypothetical protein R3C10_13780 [Pirellulales bacterium]
MLPDQRLDQITLDDIQRMIERNLITRDELYALADVLEDEILGEICRRLAVDCGGHASDLQQIAMTAGDQDGEAFEHDASNPIASRAKAIMARMLERGGGEHEVVDEARAAESALKHDYDEVIASIPNAMVGATLQRQRKDVAFGESVLDKVRPSQSEDDDRDHR